MKIDRRSICVFCACVFGVMATARGGAVALTISFPNGAPLILSPSAPTPVQIVVSGDSVVAGSVALFYRVVPAAYQQFALTPGSGGAYSGNLPMTTCGTTVQWYVQAEGVDAGVTAAPFAGASAPFEAVAGVAQTVASYNFQTAVSWTISGTPADGAWALGVPIGCNRGDPPTDYDGSGSCFLTGPSLVVSPPTCDTDVDNGITRLISPVFDLSTYSDPHVLYARWFANAATGGVQDDSFVVQISQDGGSNWQLLETVGPDPQASHPEVAGGWHPRILRIANHLSVMSAVRVRFVAADQGVASTVEAALDAFAIVNLSCGGVTCVRGDLTGDGQVDGRDVARFTRLVVTGGASPVELCAGDLEPAPDNSLDAGDIAALVNCIVAGGCG